MLYCSTLNGNSGRQRANVTETTSSLCCQSGEDTASLKHVANIVADTDMSPFEIIHSGLVTALLTYLTSSDMTQRDSRLCKFLRIFLSLHVS